MIIQYHWSVLYQIKFLIRLALDNRKEFKQQEGTPMGYYHEGKYLAYRLAAHSIASSLKFTNFADHAH